MWTGTLTIDFFPGPIIEKSTIAEMEAAMCRAEVPGVLYKGVGTVMNVAVKQTFIVASTDEMMSCQKQRSCVYSALVLARRFDSLAARA